MRKILILCNDLELGGIQKSLIEFLSYLVKSQAFKVDLMLWQKDGPLQKMIPNDVHVIFQEYPTTLADVSKEKSRINKIALLFQFLKAQLFKRILKKPWLFYTKTSQHYDIAISFTHNGLPRFFSIDRVSAAKKFLWFHHGSYKASSPEKMLDQQYFKRFDKIVTVSFSNKTMLSQTFPTLQKNITVIPNIINSKEIISKANEVINDMPNDPGSYNFVTVSRFSKEKGLDVAVKTACALKKKGLQFKWYFIGDGDQFLAIHNLAKQMNVADVCVFAGSKENPYPYMKNADLYVQSSYVEAHPITINEALVLKKLIVTTDIPSVREVLQGGELGVLCKPDPDVFANEIFRLLHDGLSQNNLMNKVEYKESNNEAAYEAINSLLKIEG
ncbi:glycosyltransferase [Chryseobacterium koreense]